MRRQAICKQEAEAAGLATMEEERWTARGSKDEVVVGVRQAIIMCAGEKGKGRDGEEKGLVVGKVGSG